SVTYFHTAPRIPPSFPTRRSSDLRAVLDPGILAFGQRELRGKVGVTQLDPEALRGFQALDRYRLVLHARDGLRVHIVEFRIGLRSEEHTSELQSRENLVCRLLLEK